MRVKEDSVLYYTIRPLDKNGSAFTPGSCRYRIHDKLATTELVAWTTIATADLSSAMEITIPASVNAIINDNLDYETKVITVQTDFGEDYQHTDDDEWDVENLSGV